MDELRSQAYDLISSLNEEQLRLVLLYARCVKDGDDALVVNLEELVENPA